jgi:hypothetical protein
VPPSLLPPLGDLDRTIDERSTHHNPSTLADTLGDPTSVSYPPERHLCCSMLALTTPPFLAALTTLSYPVFGTQVGVVGGANFYYAKDKMVKKGLNLPDSEKLGDLKLQSEEMKDKIEAEEKNIESKLPGYRLAQKIGERLAGHDKKFCLVTGGVKGAGHTVYEAFHSALKGSESDIVSRVHTVLPMNLPELEDAKDEKSCQFSSQWIKRDEQGSGLEFTVANQGRTHRIGHNKIEHQRFNSTLPVLIVIEGGPGAFYEGWMAYEEKFIPEKESSPELSQPTQRRNLVIPLGCVGGSGKQLHEKMVYDYLTLGYSQQVSKEMTWNWNLIGREYKSFGTGSDQEDKDIDTVAQAVVDLVEAFYESKHERWLEDDKKRKMSRSTDRRGPDPLSSKVKSKSIKGNQVAPVPTSEAEPALTSALTAIQDEIEPR